MTPYKALQDQLKLNQGLPYTPNWSAAPDFMRLIVDHVLQHKPTTIFECSSGLTSLMLARCCQLNQQGHVYSLENGAEYAGITRDYIARYALQEYATIIHAPLQASTIKDTEYSWYSTQAIPDISIDMLVIDGPPGYIQKNARYPALPLLFERFAEHCVVFMDDAGRTDERAIVELWQAEYPALTHEYLETERGCSVLHIDKRMDYTM